MAEPLFSDDTRDHDTAEGLEPAKPGSRLIAILLIGAVAIGLAYVMRPVPAGLGVPLSDLQLEPLTGDGQPLTLDDLSGKITLVNFWGTWCRPCMIEFPHIAELNERLRDAPDFMFVSVSCPRGSSDAFEETKERTLAYLTEENHKLRTYYDRGAITRFALMEDAELSSFGFPTTMVIDRKGIIRGFWQGYRPGLEREIEAHIRDLL